MKRRANQSNNSGWVGGCPLVPNSLAVRTMGLGKNSPQKRLTATREVSGCDGSTNQRARSNRLVPETYWAGGKQLVGTSAVTRSPLDR